jgi:hypothetical protein
MTGEVQIEKGPVKRLHKRNKFDNLIAYLKTLREDKFTGSIRIDFSQGGIGRIEKFEEVLRKME